MTGTAPPPGPAGLARLLAGDMGRAVDLIVLYVPQQRVSVPEPGG